MRSFWGQGTNMTDQKVSQQKCKGQTTVSQQKLKVAKKINFEEILKRYCN
jgi:hypothetical protein